MVSSILMPYVATIYPVGQSVSGAGVLQNLSAGEPSAVNCYFERLTTSEAFQRFGVEIKQPGFIMCPVASASLFATGAEVHVGGSVYSVEGVPLLHDFGNEADHAEILLAFKQYGIGR